MNLPALTTTPPRMVDTPARVAGPEIIRSYLAADQ